MATHAAQFEVKTGARDDLDLVHASQNGDVDAFEQLVKRYDCRLLRIAQSVTHNREDSQDAVQEAFFKAYQHLAEFREDSQFATWLIRITVNQSLMTLRKHRAVREVSQDEDFTSSFSVLKLPQVQPRTICHGPPSCEEETRQAKLHYSQNQAE